MITLYLHNLHPMFTKMKDSLLELYCVCILLLKSITEQQKFELGIR